MPIGWLLLTAALAWPLAVALSPWRGTAARALTPPLGRALPTRYVVGGHSAGGHFAGAVGARLDANGYSDLAGAVLLDPVASGGFSADLMALSDGGERPVLAVAARPNVANLFNNAFGALEALPSDYTGVQLVWSGFRFGWPYGGSCHTDAEGDDGDVIGNAAALCVPTATQYERLRELASVWAHDLATGTRTAAYWCDDENDRSTCGSAIAPLVTGSRPVAATIPA